MNVALVTLIFYNIKTEHCAAMVLAPLVYVLCHPNSEVVSRASFMGDIDNILMINTLLGEIFQ